MKAEKSGRFLLIGFLALFAALAGVSPVAAERPVKAEQIPVYAGAVLINEEQYPKEQGLRSGVRRTYSVAAAPEAVLAFYEQKVMAKKRFGEPGDENLLKPGQSTDPYIQVYFWDEDQLVDVKERGITIGERAWIKKALGGRARDKKEGKWVESADIEWHHRDSATSMTKLQIMIQDTSADEETKKYSLKTEIIFDVANYDYAP